MFSTLHSRKNCPKLSKKSQKSARKLKSSLILSNSKKLIRFVRGWRMDRWSKRGKMCQLNPRKSKPKMKNLRLLSFKILSTIPQVKKIPRATLPNLPQQTLHHQTNLIHSIQTVFVLSFNSLNNQQSTRSLVMMIEPKWCQNSCI